MLSTFHLHPAQTDIILDQAIDLTSSHLNIGGYIQLTGRLEEDALQTAVCSSYFVFDALRLRYDINSVPFDAWYVKDSPNPINLSHIDFSKESNATDIAKQWMRTQFNIPFKVNRKDLLFETYLVKVEATKYFLFVKCHHLVMDGYSFTIWAKYVADQYQNLINNSGRLFSFPSYLNYLQNSNDSCSPYKNDTAYWVQKVESQQPIFSTKKPNLSSKNQKSITRHHITCLPDTTNRVFTQLRYRTNASVQQITIAALLIYFHKIYNKTELVFGMPVHKRNFSKDRDVLGVLSGFLLFKGEYNDKKTVQNFLKEIVITQREDYKHPNLFLHSLNESLNKNVKEDFLFQIMIHYALLNFNLDFGPELNAFISELTSEDGAIPLSLWWKDYGPKQPLELMITYREDYFSDFEITLFVRRLLFIIEQCDNLLDSPLSSVQVLLNEEFDLIKNVNAATLEIPQESLITLFEKRTQSNPSSIAVTDIDGSHITYQNLNYRSNQVAHFLNKKGLGRNSIVAVGVGRSVNLVVSILAVLKAGSCYLPIDLNQPEQRSHIMIKNAGVNFLITDSTHISLFDFFDVTAILQIDSELSYIPSLQTRNLEIYHQPEDLVYVIHTSGTTGQPKGVAMPHQALLNLLIWQETNFREINTLRTLQFSSSSFDVSFQEIFSTLCFGKELVLISEEDRKDMSFLVQHITDRRVDTLFVPYQILNALCDYSVETRKYPFELKVIYTAGEALIMTDSIRQFLRSTGTKLVNQYGPSETHVVSSYELLEPDFAQVFPPIGKPVLNTQLYILDKKHSLCGIEQTGELYIGGRQLARGYINNPELTGEKFISLSIPEISPNALPVYKTGDICKYLANGSIEFIGREDRQIKIRGYRVELSEIEDAISTFSLISQVIVLSAKDSHNLNFLAAYIIPKANFLKEDMLTYLRERLPEYMIPQIWIELTQFPLLSNGKINYGAFPKPEYKTRDISRSRTILENEIASIWKTYLKVKEVGLLDSFFELGGHSLVAARIVSEMRKKLGTELDIKTLFTYTTVSDLAQYLMEKISISSPFTTATIDQSLIPASFHQNQLWFINNLQGGLPFHMAALIEVEGSIDSKVLERSFIRLLEKHEVLRTSLFQIEQEVFQQILPSSGWEINRISGLSQRKLEFLIDQPFDLSRDYPLRVYLELEDAGTSKILIVIHHIAADGWSIPILIDDLTHLYSLIEKGQEEEPTEISPIQYSHFAVWQKARSEEADFIHKINYWKDELTQIKPAVSLPFRMSKSGVGPYKASTIVRKLDGEDLEQLRTFATEHEVTLYMLLLGGLNVLLHRYTEENELLVGTPVANRKYKEIESLIGYFVNTILIRTSIEDSQTFITYLKHVKAKVLQAYENEEVPYISIVESLTSLQYEDRSDLFKVKFGLHESVDYNRLYFGVENNVKVFIPAQRYAQVEISIDVYTSVNSIEIALTYNAELYMKDDIDYFLDHYLRLLKCILANPNADVGSYNFIGVEEKQKIFGFNSKSSKFRTSDTLIDLFESAVNRYPNDNAVICGTKELNYFDLNRQANILANHLLSLGLAKGDTVAIYINKSIESVVALLGILKAGGVFLAIDPMTPPERNHFILCDATVQYIIRDSDYPEQNYWPTNIKSICIDKILLDPFAHSELNPQQDVCLSDLAYIIYTSGSTGKPKGVMVEHGGIPNLAKSQQEPLQIYRGTKVMQFAAFTFDAACYEIFCTLLNRGQLYICPNEVAKDKQLFVDFVNKNEIDLAVLPPSYLALIASERIRLKTIVSAGEQLPYQLAEMFLLKGIKLINAYGPTENTVCTTLSENPLLNYRATTIGTPLPNIDVFILDAFRHPVPIGIKGELHIGGAALARGYIGEEKHSSAFFWEDSTELLNGGRLYKSGDMGRWMKDGNIEFLGRKDQQIKIRGFRIELRDIESALERCENVLQAKVLTREMHSGNTQLIAFVTATEKFERDIVLDSLKTKLPDYMIPGLLVRLDNFPLTVNGKINIKELLSYENSVREYPQDQKDLSGTEAEIAAIWLQVLGEQPMSASANFFELGGDSIKIIQLISLLKEKFCRDIKLLDLYQAETLSSQASLLDNTDRKTQNDKAIISFQKELAKLKNLAGSQSPHPEEISEVIPVTDIQSAMIYHSLLDEKEAVYHDQMVLKSPKFLDIPTLTSTLKYLIKKHEILRAAFRMDLQALPLAIIYHDCVFKINELDFREIDSGNLDNSIEQFLNKQRSKPFELEKAPLWRCHVIHCPERDILIWECHHAILDGWSVALLNSEWMTAYHQLRQGISLNFESLACHLRDSVFQYQLSKNSDHARRYWQRTLLSREKAEFFTDRPCYKREVKLFDPMILKALKAQVAEDGLSVKSVVLGAHMLCLYLLNNENELVVGLVSNMRPSVENGDKLLGCFLNTLPFPIDFREKKESYLAYFERIQKKIKETVSHEMPLADIAHICDTERKGNPFFDTIFNFINFHVYEELKNNFDSKKITKEELEYGYGATNTFLDCNISITEDELCLIYIQRKEFFSEKSLNDLCKYFENIIKAYLEHPTASIDRMDILGAKEISLLLHDFNQTNHIIEEPSSHYWSLFEKQVAKTPEHIAVRSEGHGYTYSVIYNKACVFSDILRTKKIGPNCLVGICLSRSLDMIVALLAIMKAGAAYLPIDPYYPIQRKQFLLEDAKCKYLITEADKAHIQGAVENLNYNEEMINDLRLISFTHDCSTSLPEGTAYVMYTSGSTGLPKGVIIQHKALINRIMWAQAYFELTHEDAVLQKTNYCFDVSAWELFWPLITGARLVLARPVDANDTDYLNYIIRQESITVIHFVPSLLELFLQERRNHSYTLKYILCSGEVLKPHQLKKAIESRVASSIFNLYGPTEAAIDVTCWHCPSQMPDRILIGKPVWNTQLYILTQHYQIAPIGVAGELYIGGDQLAYGYLHRPELSGKRFLEIEIGSGLTKRLYKTGDIARWNIAGEVEFLGREDDQVKLRGQRIELGEIEYHLSLFPHVMQSAVILKQENGENKRLIAFITLDQPLDSSAEIDLFLKQRLPGHMIPASYILLQQIPLTTNGKVDRKALEILSITKQKEIDNKIKGNPETETQALLKEIWKELLKKDDVGIHDNFFELGGDSIISLQVISRLKKAGYSCSARTLFENPTLEELSHAIFSNDEDGTYQAEQNFLTGTYPLTLMELRHLSLINNQINEYCQYITLELSKDLPVDTVNQAAKALIRHHDGLRLQLNQTEKGWTQQYSDQIEDIDVIDLSENNIKNRIQMDKTADIIRTQSIMQINLKKGKSTRFTMIKTPDLFPANLLIVVAHHFVIDTVSWILLVEDLSLLLSSPNDNLVLGRKTSSVRQAVNCIHNYSKSETLSAEQHTWENIIRHFTPLYDKKERREDIFSTDYEFIRHSIPSALTETLFKKSSLQYNTKVNVIILAALVQSLCTSFERKSVIVSMESHGRSFADDHKLNLSRTIGWFTSLFPIHLSYEPGSDLNEQISIIQNCLSAIPTDGIGFGILRYINKETSLEGEFSNVLFNYMGEVGYKPAKRNYILGMQTISNEHNHNYQVDDKLILNSYVQDGVIVFEWVYCTKCFTNISMQKVVAQFNEILSQIMLESSLEHDTELRYKLSKKIISADIDDKEVKRFFNINDSDEEVIFEF